MCDLAICGSYLFQIAAGSVRHLFRPQGTLTVTLHTRRNTRTTSAMERNGRCRRQHAMLRGATSHTTFLCGMAPATATVVTHCASLMPAYHPQPTTTKCCCLPHERRRMQPAEAVRRAREQRCRTGSHALRRDGRRPCPAGQPCFAHCSARPRSWNTASSKEKSGSNAERVPSALTVVER